MTGFTFVFECVLFRETSAMPLATEETSPEANRRRDTLADAAAIALIASAGIFMV